jgi:hypothetical protein
MTTESLAYIQGQMYKAQSPMMDGSHHVDTREVSRHVRLIHDERQRLLTALHDAIDRPLGVVPDSALEFYDPALTNDNKTV